MRYKRILWGGVLFAAGVLAVGVFMQDPRVSLAADAKEDIPAVRVPNGFEVATFAGGCFWCMESPFDKLDGVYATISGYTQGHVENPTYEQVCGGNTGHTEALQVVYDPSKITYAELLTTFWHNIDPFDERGQFCDKGEQYRSGIYYHDEMQKQAAEASLETTRDELSKAFRGVQIATEIKPATSFYDAEGYHQNYKDKNPFRYNYYRTGCGRDARLKDIWGENAGK